jgi:tetratricopeptide (TPR) repeat protein
MAEDTMFQEAVEALGQGDRAKARDLLTRLLESDQSNPLYWIWMSAAVDTAKERIYCLQTALRLDPENATAKRGLVLLGALPPDENVKPFPLDRPRLWDEELALAGEQPKEKGLRGFLANPVVKIAGFGLIGVVLVGLVILGLRAQRDVSLPAGPVHTAGPSPTITLTPTLINATSQAPEVAGTPAPLSELLDEPYTPTPLYVITPREPQSGDLVRVFDRAYANGDWQEAIRVMRDIAGNEPEAADPYYYIGEAYRFMGDYRNALEAYSFALQLNPNLGAAYLGLARARLMGDFNADVEQLFNAGIERDPNFGELYLERGKFYLDRGETQKALADLALADRLLNGSPWPYYYQAQAFLVLEDIDSALEAIEKANDADVTLLPVYLTLGQVYLAQGDLDEAAQALELYAKYETRSLEAYTLLGRLYYLSEDCEQAIQLLSRAVSLDVRAWEAYLYRGMCYVELEQADAAENDLQRVYSNYEDEFDFNIALMRTYMLQEHFGDAFLQGERVLSLAETDEELARAYYWRAVNFEYRQEEDNAIEAWAALLDLPADVVSRQMRREAQERLNELWTPTPSPTAEEDEGTSTPAPTRTPSPTPTPE